MSLNDTTQTATSNESIQIIAALIGVGATILGVILGFLLQEWKEKRRVRRNLSQIKEELRANFHILNWKRPILKDMIEHLENGKVLPGESVRCLTAIYREHFASMSTHLPELDRNSIHVIHERLRILDESMSGYEAEVKALVGANPQAAKQIATLTILPKLKDLLASLSQTQELIKQHLNQKPEDVLGIKSAGPLAPP